jgi:hypothetical protein
MGRKHWLDDEKESLFNIAKEYDFNKMGIEITIYTPEIKEIHRKFNSLDRDLLSILYKLKEMKFLTGPISNNKFKCNKKRSLLDFYNNPSFKNLTKPQITKMSESFSIGLASCKDVEELIQYMSQEVKISELNVKINLFNQGLIILNNSNAYVLKEHFFSKMKKEYDNFEGFVESKKADTKLINGIRAGLSEIYSKNNSFNSKFVSSYDGTGFGKSYGVIDTWIDDAINKNWHSDIHHDVSIFSSPIKSQQKKDASLIRKAEENNIRFLSVLADSDVSSLEHKDWITGETNESKYTRWCKSKSAWMTTELKRISGLMNSIKFNQTELEIVEKSNEFERKVELEKTLFKLRYSLREELVKIGLKALNRKNSDIHEDIIKYNDSFDLENSERTTKEKTGVYAEMVMTIFPLYYASYYPCCLMVTTDKSDTNNVNIPFLNNNSEYIIKTCNIFNIVSKTKEKDSEVKISKHLSSTEKEQLDFLMNEYYQVDEENCFENNKVSFTFINDEEHEAYTRISDNLKKNVLTKETILTDIFSGFNRCLMKLKNTDEKETEFYKEIEDLNNKILKISKLHCDYSKNVDFKSIIKLFVNSVEGIWIGGDKVEQVMNITKNAFSFTNKDYVNAEDLKSISIKTNQGRTRCDVYTKTSPNDDPTLYDVFQATITMIAACSQILDSSVLSSLNKIRDSGESQDDPFRKFIKKCQNVKKDFEHMFDFPKDGDVYINKFLTYFQPKMIFSIIKDRDIHYKEMIENKIKIDLNIELRRELPEVKMQRILMGTGNSIITLSATTGISQSYTGGLNRGFFKNYEGQKSLGYDVCQRTNKDVENLNLLREKRAEYRDISINTFCEKNEKTIPFNSIEDEKYFYKVYKNWEKALLANFNDRNPYRLREMKRTLFSMLRVGFDGKNTLSLALSNRFKKLFQKLSTDKASKMLGITKVYDNANLDHQGIFEIKPFKKGYKIRVILYDAALEKTGVVQEAVKIDSLDVKIAFISSYKSAGTGLNYFVSYIGKDGKLLLDEDFERNILINSPHFSSVKSQNGMNSIDNRLLLFKYISDSEEVVKLSDMTTNMISGKYFEILMNQHFIEILKQVMQSIGRTERRDTNMQSEIYLPEDLMIIVASTFNHLAKDFGNENFLNSMSLANTKLYEKSIEHVLKGSFETKDERFEFEELMKEEGYLISNVLLKEKLFQGKYINDIRNGKSVDCSLNDILRSEEMYTNPKSALKKLLNNEYVLENNLEEYIEMMFIKKEDYENIVFCRHPKERGALTDLKNGLFIYDPSEEIHSNYHGSLRSSLGKTTAKTFIEQMAKPDFSEYIPHPSIIDLLKGNYGEILTKKILDHFDVEVMSNEEIISEISPKLIELFDFYVKKEESLLCIDAKNWGIMVENESMTNELIKRSEEKTDKIKTILSDNNLDFKDVNCVYANTKINKNEINTRNEIDKLKNIYYLNLFVVDNENYRKKDKTGRTTIHCDISETAIVNKTFLSLIKGENNE